MDIWSNIEISANDPELIRINSLGKKLGELRDQISSIRELITRFEACHFKYRRHLQMIKDAIITLKSSIVPNEIATNHIRHGERAWKNDTTGKSLIGQQYLWGIKSWLNDSFQDETPGHFDRLLVQKIHNWLGDKSPDKERLVRLLLARLTWDWKSYEELQHGGEFEQLEYQAARMDICHYSFPKNIDLLLQGIGCMQPVEKERFEGCGLYNSDIKRHLEREFMILQGMLKTFLINGKSNKKEKIRAWLTACLAKTIKEQIKLVLPIEEIM